jgi:LPXTG-motif cell wall-anchored protein
MKRVASFLLAAGLVVAVAQPAAATPTSSDPKTAARDAAAWLASQVNASGWIPSAANPSQPNLSVSAQAVTALASAGVGKTKVDALMQYLGQHVNDFVVRSGNDDPAALAYLILDAVATGKNPTSFGSPATNLVSRLSATQQGTGLFGTSDPTFDGAFRQGLSLLALGAAGVTNSSGTTWLEGQQCADGSWTAFRSDTALPCPPVDTVNFTGPDTNSTAMAALGLHAQGATSQPANGVTALKAVRNSGGGWGFLSLSSQATDANSTGVVLEALRTVDGTADTQGITALLALQAGCTAAASDRGGIAFQPGKGGKIVPDGLATAQATPALAEVALPIVSATMAASVPTPCTSSTVTTQGSGTATTVAVSAESGSTGSNELPRTGGGSTPLALFGTVALAGGLALALGKQKRRG